MFDEPTFVWSKNAALDDGFSDPRPRDSSKICRRSRELEPFVIGFAAQMASNVLGRNNVRAMAEFPGR
jgi:hypothetical protein